MPFLQRVIEPDSVCRDTLPIDEQGGLDSAGISNELECITNGTLANIIRQLSSLSKHAENMFSSLFKDSSHIVSRTNSLQNRVDQLAIKVMHLDSTAEEVSLQDIHMRKAFRSFILYEQQVVSRGSMPAAIRDIYKTCDKPPPLDKLNPYREDGKQGLKFYTDPNYFFDLWKQEMLKDTGKVIHDRTKKIMPTKEGVQPSFQNLKAECKRHRRNRQLIPVRDHIEQSVSSKESADSSYYSEHGDRTSDRMLNDQYDNHAVRPNSLEIHSAYLSSQENVQTDNSKATVPSQKEATEHSPNHRNHHRSQKYTSPSTKKADANARLQKASTAAANTNRPIQPPPTPPVTGSPLSSSGSSTPTISDKSSSSSMTRSRSNTHSREKLPPPPPPPIATLNHSDAHNNSISDCDDMLKAVLSASFSAQIISFKKETAKLPISNKARGSDQSLNEVPSKVEPSAADDNNKSDLPPPDHSPPPPQTVLENEKEPSPPNAPEVETPKPPPPPPPPLPSLDDLVFENAKSGSMGTSQNAELCSITSESASETSSVSKFSESTDVKSKNSPHAGQRSDLLQAIREGIKLRRVEGIKQKEVEKAAPLHDVASILARRVAMEFSDSESPPESEYDSDGWGDESECTK